MKVSLIITTYNWKEALELSLLSAFAQNILPAEIIIADDGSKGDTKRTINVLSKKSPMPIIHSWQEDKGFRLTLSRNKAIAKSSGDYIVMIDGDIIMAPDFINDHCKIARTNFFVQGSRVILSEKKSWELIERKNIKLSFFNVGFGNRKNIIRSSLLSSLFSKANNSLSGIRGCNIAFWRNDAVRINGFNEDLVGWGRDDSEFAARLINIGLKRLTLKFRANAYHLFHPICSRESLAYL